MAEKQQLEFFLLRYAPHALRDEWINFGIVLFDPAENRSGFADVRFSQDWRRLRCLDPDADIEILEALEREIKTDLREPHSRAALMKKLTDSFSNLIQISPVRECLTSEPAKELETLAGLLIEALPRAGLRTVSGRQRILEKMRNAFEQAGLWQLMMHDIPAAAYTRPGDPLHLDFAYRTGDSIKVFHAVSLKASVDQAVMLAVRYPSIQAGMRRASEATPMLTAVVDDGLDRQNEQVQFALGMMEEASIRVEPAAQLSAIAQAARQELLS